MPAVVDKVIRLHDGQLDLTNFHEGQRAAWHSKARFVAIIAGAQRLATDTPIRCKGRFARMGDIQVGETVYDEDGRECLVTHVHEIAEGRPCHAVSFDDGASVIADDEHPWVIETNIEPRRLMLTTAELRQRVDAGDRPRLCGEYGRYVFAVRPVDSRPSRCITVDSPTGTYLCGPTNVPTHNSGKSAIGPAWLWREIKLRGPGEYIVVAPTFPILNKKPIPLCQQLFESMMKLGKLTRGNSPTFEFSKDGMRKTFGHEPAVDDYVRIFFIHAQDPESLESITAKAVWCDEAGQLKFRAGSWEAIRRRLSVNRGRALLTSTPYGDTWLKRKIYDPWEAGDPAYDVIQFDSLMNPAFSREEYEQAKRDLPGWRFDMMHRGQFTRPSGMIYDCFDRKVHTRKRFPIPDQWPRYVGLDFGGINTAATFFAEDPRTRHLYAYKIYLPGRSYTARQHALSITEHDQITMAVGGSWSEDQWRDEFRAAGLPVQPAPVSDVEVGIIRVYGALVRGEISIFDDLDDLIDEFNTYSRVTDDDGRPTEAINDKKDFHLLDGIRMLISKIRPGTSTRLRIGLPPRNMGMLGWDMHGRNPGGDY
jgi:hypothetical protein